MAVSISWGSFLRWPSLIRALLFEVDIRAPDFWMLPYGLGPSSHYFGIAKVDHLLD